MEYLTIEELKRLIGGNLLGGRNIDLYVDVKKEFEDETQNVFDFYLYTGRHKYAIIAMERKGEDASKGYLGCICCDRKPYPGESHTRGHDLPDGPMTRDTWNDIVHAIARNELVQLHPKNDALADEVVIVVGDGTDMDVRAMQEAGEDDKVTVAAIEWPKDKPIGHIPVYRKDLSDESNLDAKKDEGSKTK